MTWLIPYMAASLIAFTVYRKRRALAFLIGLSCAAYPFVALVALDAERAATPTIYDATLARIDGPIGRAAIHGSESLLKANAILRVFVKWVYDWNLPIALLFSILAVGRHRFALSLGVAGMLGLACYLIIPAVGPGASASDYRNAMPSVHFAVTLLAALAVWPSGRVARVLAISFVGITALATLGFREHYVIDLIAGVPFAGAIWFAVTCVTAPRVAYGGRLTRRPAGPS